MKLFWITTVFAFLLFVIYTQAQHKAGPEQCCFYFYTRNIPERFIKTYQPTHSSCPKKAIIFTTTRDKQICVDPDMESVQRVISKLSENDPNQHFPLA
ncbi:hypothetical protein ACEWY4_022138 [Coilia grayii]|uniref:C-C motif chemokine n=1 Tax=Coilia grayii TaxID=363190 RepID=A0ABD1J7L6_9TELE